MYWTLHIKNIIIIKIINVKVRIEYKNSKGI